VINVRVGDIFESRMQTLVNTVNCVGIMGKGLALEFKKRFPDMYEDYVDRCSAKQVRLGEPYLYHRLLTPWILNFPTKDHWRSVSRLSDITAGLEYLKKHYREWEITSLAVPALGCSNGQLEWRVVGPTLYQYLSQLDIPVELYAPYGTSGEDVDISFLRSSNLTSTNNVHEGYGKFIPAHIGLVEILARIEQEPYHWPVGRVTFQKITYFATMLGLPTGLQFGRGSYGPFSPELLPLVARLANNGLVQERQLGRMLAVKPGPTYKDVANRLQTELAQWEPIINQITDLFLRMRTQQAEVAATVHFTAQMLSREEGETVSEMAILDGVKRWKQKRRPPLSDEEIAQSIRDLNVLGWIKARPSPELPLAQDAALLDV